MKPGTTRFVGEHGRGGGEVNVAIYLVALVEAEPAG